MSIPDKYRCPLIGRKPCPQAGPDRGGCPAWVEFVAEDLASGRQEVKRDCVLQVLPVFLTEVMKASNRPAAAVESCRNEIAAGLGAIARASQHAIAVHALASVTGAAIEAGEARALPPGPG